MSDESIVRRRFREYVWSLPIRIVIGALVFGGAWAYRAYSDEPPVAVKAKARPEEPASGGGGIDSLYQEDIDRAIAAMVEAGNPTPTAAPKPAVVKTDPILKNRDYIRALGRDR